ncbi:MAG TPA: PDZ domain-containing protein [Blastocatellia bacterium]|nr:PDZ domain-containing protein [Blastocatellia bacterium]
MSAKFMDLRSKIYLPGLFLPGRMIVSMVVLTVVLMVVLMVGAPRESWAQRGGMAYLGVYLGDVNEDRAKQLNLKEVRGAVVGKVEEGSPAARGGLQENDVILTFNDKQVWNRAQIYQLLLETRPQNQIILGISRQGEYLSLSVELSLRHTAFSDDRQRLFKEPDAMLVRSEELEQEAAEQRKRGDEKGALELSHEAKELRARSEELRASINNMISNGELPASTPGWHQNYNLNSNRYYLGLVATPLTEQLTEYFKVAHGLLVSEVRAGGSAERAGIKAGDCVVAVNEEPVTSISDLNRLIDRLGKDRTAGEKTVVEFSLTMVRDRAGQRIKVKLEPR